MFGREHGLAALVERFHELDHHALSGTLWVVPMLLHGATRPQGVADEYGFDEAQPIIAVGKCLKVDLARSLAHRDAEHERAVRDALLEILRLAPLGVHVVRIEIAGLARVQDNVGLGYGASGRKAR